MAPSVSPQTPSCILSAASSAFCAAPVHFARSLRPQRGFLRPQRKPKMLCVLNAPLCALSAPLCKSLASPPRGDKVIYSTVTNHRPVDYSSPCGFFIALWITILFRAWTIYLQCIVFTFVFSAVRCRQRSSRRPPTAVTSSSLGYAAIAASQSGDAELDKILLKTALKMKKLTLPGTKVALYAEFFIDADRLYLPQRHRSQAFRQLHDLSHPGIRASQHLMTSRFIWEDVRLWTHLHRLSSLHDDSAHSLSARHLHTCYGEI